MSQTIDGTPKVIPENTRRDLIAAAQRVRQNAYAPFSHYLVGAALITPDGKIYTGCNVENSSYGGAICAERVAVTKAVSEGERQFDAVAVVTRDGGSPCGMCRQFMYEFAPDLLVIIADETGKIMQERSLRELLPDGFRFEPPG
jgi:cytidine deaminase